MGPEARPIFIVDNVIAPPARRETFRYFKSLDFYFSDQDRPDTDHVRHLQHPFPERSWKTNSTLKYFRESAEAISDLAGIDFGPLDRIYANFNLYGDFQFSHSDGPNWTALFFVNDRWEHDWGGELLFYDGKKMDSPSYSIFPKSGRMVVFDGEIVHRGGVPSKYCLVPRISLAIKFMKQTDR